MGFQHNPENINKDGRPNKGETYADLLKEEGEKLVLDGQERITKKEKLARRLYKEAIDEGNLKAAEMIMDRQEGKPKQDANIQTSHTIELIDPGEKDV